LLSLLIDGRVNNVLLQTARYQQGTKKQQLIVATKLIPVHLKLETTKYISKIWLLSIKKFALSHSFIFYFLEMGCVQFEVNS